MEVEFPVLFASLQQAKKFGYDMSLFERLYKYFRKEFAGQPLTHSCIQTMMLC